MKLSKQQIKQHQTAVDVLNKDILTYDEKVYVYENWIPAYEENIGEIGSFFTPLGLARDFATLEVVGDNIIDLCAGIGSLSFHYFHRMLMHDKEVKITCIEQSQAFVEVGKKLLPSANWICADALNKETYTDLIKNEKFDYCISNPPFGKIKTTTNTEWIKYAGSEFEYKIIAVGNEITKYGEGAYIIPQSSAPFRYSNLPNTKYQPPYEVTENTKTKKWLNDTNTILSVGTPIDTGYYYNDWVGTKVLCEIVLTGIE
ncbi:methyltransferase [Sphingobacterium multivorum]|uniref:methyltransferase n=1 Tax=Sphingobacterium multivorum TaxID=28454 RepID=UPI0028AB76BC|nr:methyltransferase [Sphingobacterium multivorum]